MSAATDSPTVLAAKKRRALALALMTEAVEEFGPIALTGNRQAIEISRGAVTASVEAWLDRVEEVAWAYRSELS